MTKHHEGHCTGQHGNRPWAWTAERAERLKNLWMSGALSCSAIGSLLGVSRSAVIGKGNRMKLPAKKKAPPPQYPAPGQRKLTHARKPDPPRPSRNASNQPWRLPQPDCEATAAVDLPPDQSDCAVTILGLTDSTCRWPIERPAEPMLYCGAAPIDGLSYCPRHHRLAHKRAA